MSELCHHGSPLAAVSRAVGQQSPFTALLSGLNDVQRPYVLHPDAVVTNHAARRSGKSHGNAAFLLQHAPRNPDGLTFFAASTVKAARRIIAPTMRELSRDWGLNLEWSSQDTAFIAPNGFQVWLLGLSDESEADKLRGAAHGFVAGVIDEAATINDAVLKDAVLACALPALGENAGRLRISGTPGPLMSGFFYEQCQIRRNFHWDARANPKLKRGGERFLAAAIAENPGWTWDTPTFKREYLGIWCEDKDALVYPYYWGRNLIYQGSEFTEGRTILGVDVGFEDGNGYCISRSQPPNNPEVHILRCYEKRGQNVFALAAEIENLRRLYNVNHIFIDEGNNGLMVSKTLQGMGIPCKATPKGLKRPRIEFVRGGLAAGTIKVVRGQCDTLIGEWEILIWNDKRTDVDERYSNECSDATIYSCLPQNIAYQHLLEEPEIGTAQHTNKQQQIDKAAQERESITKADLDKYKASVDRTRGYVTDLQRPSPTVAADSVQWRR